MDNTTTETLPDVGSRIRLLREERGYSLRKLSELSGVSINAISLIERGENSPTVASLHALAGALSVAITDLFRPSEETRAVFVPQKSRLATTVGSITMASLGYGLRHQQLEPFVVTLQPRQRHGAAPDLVHPGQEFVHCLTGRVECRVGPRSFTLEPGDSLLFEASEPHRFWNPDEIPAEMLLVFQAPGGTQIARERHLEGTV